MIDETRRPSRRKPHKADINDADKILNQLIALRRTARVTQAEEFAELIQVRANPSRYWRQESGDCASRRCAKSRTPWDMTSRSRFGLRRQPLCPSRRD